MQRARDERIEETERGCEGPQKSQSLRVVGPSNVFLELQEPTTECT